MSSDRLPMRLRQALGLLFLLVIGGFLALTIASYRQAFTPVVWVELAAGRTGSQLVQHADVKIRGVRIGEVRSVSATPDGVRFRLALDPARAAEVPRNVTARLVPKTLFGERYVDLLMPPRPSPTPIGAGDVIHEDRSKRTVEINQVWDNLMPVLKTVQPQKLATTLTALSTGLGGNGEKLGRTLVQLNGYLADIEPTLTDLTADIRDAAKVADTYAEVAPNLLRGLNDLTVTSQTVLDQEQALQSLYDAVIAMDNDLFGFLTANGDNVVDLARTSRPVFELLARYSPELPCVFRDLDTMRPRLDEVWGTRNGRSDHKLRLTVELTESHGKYLPGRDEPQYADKRGPACYQLPASGIWPQHPPGGPIKDGSTPYPGGAR